MPNVGDIEYRYGRVYIYTQPNIAAGPGTWRPSNPDSLAGPGGGGGGPPIVSAKYDFDGVLPVVVDTSPGVGSNPTIVQTSLDFQQLDNRTT